MTALWHFPYAHPLEWFLVVSAIGALAASWSSLRAVVSRITYLDAKHISGGLRITAELNHRFAWKRVIIAMLGLIAGLFSIFNAPPPPSYDRVPQTIALLLMLTLIMWVLIGSAILERYARRQLAYYANLDPVTMGARKDRDDSDTTG
jgi:hypothetical protein